MEQLLIDVYKRQANGIYSTCRHSSGMSSGTYVPVSYTHLDVYKRQG